MRRPPARPRARSLLGRAPWWGAVAGALACALGAHPAVAQGRDDAKKGTGESAAVRDARAAQRSFEALRRARLPLDEGPREEATRNRYYGTGCPVRIGRLCWWDNTDDGAPPPEVAAVSAARGRLLDALVRAAAADSGNFWVTGQRIRYAVEARRPADAIAAAQACTTDALRCLELRGTAFHLTNHPADAAAAFDSADALRTPTDRCAWYDVSPWLDRGEARAYGRLPCGSPERARWEARFWRLAQPLWLLPVNDLRNEWNARRVMARVHADGGNPYGMGWGSDLAEIALRYGWPTGWTLRASGGLASPYAFVAEPGQNVIGHEPAPAYDFVARAGTLAVERTGVADVPDRAWTLRPPPEATATPMRYAPTYAGGGIGTPTHQLARFRHGDSTVVVAAYDAARDSLWSDGRTPPSLATALLLVDDSGAVAAADRRDSASKAGVLVAGMRATPGRLLAGLELLQRDSVHTPDGRKVLGRALRERAPFHPLAPDARLSDVLVLRHSPGPSPTFAAALDSAAGTRDIQRGATIGLYWEQYRDTTAVSAGSAPNKTTSASAASPDAPAAPDTVVIAATRLTRTLRERIAGALGRNTSDRPVALRFADPGGGIGRGINLTWPDVPAGDYQLDVTLVPGTPGRSAATSTIVVHVRED